MSLPQASLASSSAAPFEGERIPAADPWQGWSGILGVTLAVLIFQAGCSAVNSNSLNGLGKNLVGRWERTGGTPETLIFGSDGTFVQLRGRTEKLAREVDGWTFATPGRSRWDVIISNGSTEVGGFKCEFRDDDELEIVESSGLKNNLKGVYRRSTGSTSDGPPPKEGTVAAKLNELKTHLASSEKQRDKLKTARVRLEKDRLDKLAEVRKAGVTKDSTADKLSESQKALVKELGDIVQEDKRIKDKIDEIEATMSKFRTVITKLNVKLVVDGEEPTGADLNQIDEAKVALRMAQEDLNRDAPPTTDPLVEAILKEQVPAKENPVDKDP